MTTSTITNAREDIIIVRARRTVVQDVRHVEECVAVLWDSKEKSYEPVWVTVDIANKSIKCTRGTYENRRVMGFYPMTKTGYKQAYHDVREYAHYTKS